MFVLLMENNLMVSNVMTKILAVLIPLAHLESVPLSLMTFAILNVEMELLILILPTTNNVMMVTPSTVTVAPNASLMDHLSHADHLLDDVIHPRFALPMREPAQPMTTNNALYVIKTVVVMELANLSLLTGNLQTREHVSVTLDGLDSSAILLTATTGLLVIIARRFLSVDGAVHPPHVLQELLLEPRRLRAPRGCTAHVTASLLALPEENVFADNANAISEELDPLVIYSLDAIIYHTLKINCLLLMHAEFARETTLLAWVVMESHLV